MTRVERDLATIDRIIGAIYASPANPHPKSLKTAEVELRAAVAEQQLKQETA